ncbi:MAG: hypothetical protein HY082_06050 [Gammaproteobacteria bacterium]|nr:hypothetical protein [Gammaproteobacteria bacterium]
MLHLENVTAGAIQGLSLAVGAGQVCRLILSSHDIKDDLFALLAGHIPPVQGRVRLLGADVYAQTEPGRVGFYRRVGIVPEQGGLISNLKTWENILLPAWHHRKLDAATAEPRVVALWREVDPGVGDLRELMGRLPDRLTTFERRLAALVRALLPEPDLLVYDFLTFGLDTAAAGRLLGLTQRFHGEKPGRVSVYLCPDDAASEKIRADVTQRIG